MSDPDLGPDQIAQANALLGRIATAPGPELDIAEAALALASLDRPGVALDRYREHLGLLVRDVGALVAEAEGGCATVADRIAILRKVIPGKYGYRGDGDTYDDLQNANLIRVIDRRRGLPVALGVLYLHAARAQGWPIVGLAFPGHFLLRIEGEDGRAILDPFNEASTPDAAELRRLLRATSGDAVSLGPEHYAPVDDRGILIRLQNNLKLRLVGSERIAQAVEIVERMLIFAPNETGLLREAALMYAHLGDYGSAMAMIDRFLAIATGDAERHHMAALMQRLRGKLN